VLNSGRILLTRISRKIVRKNYFGKSSYEYVTLWLYLPKKYHSILQPFIDQELKMTIRKANGKLQITLIPKELKP
jgi:hypothetical protein